MTAPYRSLALAFVSLTILVSAQQNLHASSHREAPITALDEKADITDFYAFVSYDDPEKVTSDIAFNGADLYVAEKSNELVLVFEDLANSPGGDIVPSAATALPGAESVALLPAYLGRGSVR
jgi:hypothetical protein